MSKFKFVLILSLGALIGRYPDHKTEWTHYWGVSKTVAHAAYIAYEKRTK